MLISSLAGEIAVKYRERCSAWNRRPRAHTYTYKLRKRLQWCRICKYVKQRKCKTCREGHRKENKDLMSVTNSQMSICCRIIPSKHICMCFHYMAGYICLLWFIYEDVRAHLVGRYYTGGRGGEIFTGNKCDGKQLIIRMLINGWRSVGVSSQQL